MRTRSRSGSPSWRRSSRRPRAWRPTRSRACSRSASGSGIVEELAEAATAAASAIAPDEGDGAASLAALAERSLAPLERIAPELGASAEELRDLAVRLHEVGSDLHRFLATLDAEPGALEAVEERLQAIADLKRRFAASSYDELLELAAAAERELGEAGSSGDPVEAAAAAVAEAEERVGAARSCAP